MSETCRIRRVWYSAAAFVMAFGRAGSLRYYEAERFGLSTKLTILLLIFRTVLYFGLFWMLFAAAEKFIKSGKMSSLFFEEGEKNAGKWWTGYVALALGWLPFLIIKYPAAVCWDTWGMITEYLNHTFSEHQSVYYTFVMGKLIEVFMRQGHANWGLFLFAALHYLMLVAAFGYSLQLLHKMKVSKPVRIAVLVSYLLNPYILDYVGVVIKDIPYTAFLMIVHLILIELFMDHEKTASNPLKMSVLFISAVHVWLLRKNGSYIMIAAGIFLLIRCVKKKLSKRPAVVLLAACLAAAAAFNFLGAHFDAKKGSVREALSVPFQQTARYVRDYGDEVTAEEKSAINEVLDYEIIAEKYDPSKSDNVKSTYKEDSSKLPAYFKTWFAQFLKHPLCYVDATWEQFYYLFVPEVDNIVLYENVYLGYEIGDTLDLRGKPFYRDIFKSTGIFLQLQKWIVSVFRRLHSLPFTKYLGNVSFWFYLLLFVTTVWLARGSDGGLIIGMLYLTLIFVLLGPVIYGHPRYMFPVIYPLPTVTLFFLKDMKR